MECPRCGEDNLPGLAHCLGCGRPLAPAAAPAASIPTVPRVAPRNPLARASAPSARPRRAWLADAQLALFLRVLRAAAWGLLPGLGAWRRGQRRRALAFAVAPLLALLLWLALWRSELQPLAWMGALSVIATSCLEEARARVPPVSPAGHALAFGLSLALALLLHAIVLIGSGQLFPRISVVEQAALPGGHFLVRPTRVQALVVDDLIVIGQISPWWSFAPATLQVGSVLATEGQVVEVVDDQLRVDGLPPRAHPLNPAARAPALPTVRLVVPPGAVAAYTDPVQLVAQDRLAGRITTRWLPAADRGPLQWPPVEPSP